MDNNHDSLQRVLSWETKIYVALAVLITVGSFLFDAWSTNWVLTILVGLASILLIEHFWIIAHRHPQAWRTFKWTLLLIALAYLLWS